MSSIFVILYETPRSQLATAGLYYQHRAVEAGPLPTQPETNTHFIARHRPTTFTRFPYNSWSIESGPLPTQPTTSPHFIGRYRPTAHSVLPLYRSNVAADFSSQAPFETNTNFLAKHAATAFRNPLALRTNIAADFSTPQTQPETNTHFLARTWPSRFALLPALRQQPATDAPLSVLAETNTHFIGRFTPPQHRIFRHNYTGSDFSTQQQQPGTNVHYSFLGTHRPTIYQVLVQLRSNAATDFTIEPPPPPDTELHFTRFFADVGSLMSR